MFLTLSFPGFFQPAFGKNPADSTAGEKLIALLAKNDCLGCEKQHTLLHQADSLSRLLTPEGRAALADNEFPLVRYHAFLFLLATDEEAAFNLFDKLKQDTAELCFMCCMIDVVPLNEQIFTHFYKYLSFRYKDGRRGTINGRSYCFQKQRCKRKTWEEKKNRLLMIAGNSIPAGRLAAIQAEADKYFSKWTTR